MKKVIKLDSGGARVLSQNIGTCGSRGCLEIQERLNRVTEPVALHEIGANKLGQWLMPAFERLQWYAVDNGLTMLDTFQVARYFGGTTHINIFARIAGETRFGLAYGPAVGLVSHVLLPLKDGKYQNHGVTVEFSDYVHADPEGTDPEFYHLGAVIRIPLTEEQINEILYLQWENHFFRRALAKIKQPIGLPENQHTALQATIKTATD